MIQTLTKSEDQYLVRTVSWEQFKTLQSAFTEIGGVRMTYCEGVLEIVGIGRLHEMICTLLGAYLIFYFAYKRIAFISTGAYTQELKGSTEYQADLSYNFDLQKEISDLCIEVVVTSGNTKKLRKYQLLGVPEVWFWQDGKISIYSLQDSLQDSLQGKEYAEIEISGFLPDLDIRHLEECLLMDSQLESILAFQDRYK